MPKRKMSDIVFQMVEPPDHKTKISSSDLSDVLVRRLGLKRKESKANHAKLLIELFKFKKEGIPLGIDKISQILGVSQSQTYEEIRKWRSIGIIDFIKIPSGDDYLKGYMLTANTINRLLDKVESSTKSFMRKTRRIAKDMDDFLMLEMMRNDRVDNAEHRDDNQPEEVNKVNNKEENDTEDNKRQ